MHAMYDDSFSESYNEPSASNLAVSSLTVENGAAERSFIRYLDVNFNDATDSVLESIVNSVNNPTTNNPAELTLTQNNLTDSGSRHRSPSRACSRSSTTRSRSTSAPAALAAIPARPPPTAITRCRSHRRRTGAELDAPLLPAAGRRQRRRHGRPERPERDRGGARPVLEPDRGRDQSTGVRPDGADHGRQRRRVGQHDRPGTGDEVQGQFAQAGAPAGMRVCFKSPAGAKSTQVSGTLLIVSPTSHSLSLLRGFI